MATYDELLTASENPDLKKHIKVACFIAAEKIRVEAGGTTNHANRVIWAKAVFADPDRESTRMLWAVLAQKQAATLTQIITATGAQVQTAVDAAVDVFAT